jgi:hypothetical protein
MKRFVMVIALACALSGSTLAGEIHTAGAPAPGDTQGPSIAVTVILTILSLVR